MAPEGISRFILRQQGIIIPEMILKKEFISEIDEKLLSQSPILVSHFLRKVAKNVDLYIDIDNIHTVTGKISEMDTLLSSQYGSLLTSDDIKILNFISQQKKDSIYDFLEIAGPLYFSLEIIDELEKNQNLYSIKISVSSSLWLFGVIFEQILHMMDRRMYQFLIDPNNPQSNKKSFERFKNLRRKQYHEHATAGGINVILSKILPLDVQKNSSIFGSTANAKSLRNKISHSNLFYDSVRNRIVCLDGTEYTIEEFIREFYKLFQFLIKWIQLSINKPITASQFSDDIVQDLQSSFFTLSKEYRKEHRYYCNRRLSTVIIRIVKEIHGGDQ
jgi:succinate dehydrogenase flavin-adding protein (antitoxin of CptAB toxin-antitoxin module)